MQKYVELLRYGFLREKCFLLDFVKITSPLPFTAFMKWPIVVLWNLKTLEKKSLDRRQKAQWVTGVVVKSEFCWDITPGRGSNASGMILKIF